MTSRMILYGCTCRSKNFVPFSGVVEVIIVFFGSGASLKRIMFFEGVLFLCFWGVRGGVVSNPKSEYLNPKQSQMFKIRIFKTKPPVSTPAVVLKFVLLLCLR